MIEFVLTGIPAIFLIVSVVDTGRVMWNYHALERAVSAGAHLAAVRGQGCVTGGNTCSVSVGTIATAIQAAGVGLPPDSLNVQLTTNSGAVTTCDPLNTCTSNTTTWPPSTASDNMPGNNVTVNGQYTPQSALSMFWPGAGTVHFGAFTLTAQSTQRIVF